MVPFDGYVFASAGTIKPKIANTITIENNIKYLVIFMPALQIIYPFSAN